MKKIYLGFFAALLLAWSTDLSAQRKFKGKIHEITEKLEKTNYTGLEPFNAVPQPSLHSMLYEQGTGMMNPTEGNVKKEQWIGISSYDLQTNGSPKHRIHQGSDGRMGASWTFHPETVDPNTPFPNRGTGYNLQQGGMWQTFPTARLEATTRTGWPNNVITESGREVVVCHAFTTDGYVVILTRDPGQTNFTETALPTDVETTDMLWPHMAVSGNTLHVLAIARPVGDGVGGIHEGLDGAVLYYRSQDGGDTWDVQDYLVPEIDSSFFSGHVVDGYAIDAKGSKVAFALFNSFADVVVVESDNNGEPGSWTKRIVNDFPLDKYIADTGYDITDIEVDTLGPTTDSLAIESCDGSGGLTIDADGRVHVVYGRTYVSDANLTDGGTVFYPGFSGLFYWNSDMPDDGVGLIDPVFDGLDVNGDNTIDSGDDLAFYGGGLTSMADIVATEDGCLVISYSQHMENYLREAIPGSPNFPESQNYRHVYITTSVDVGQNWSVPYDVTNPDVMLFPGSLAETEAVYPHIYVGTDGLINMTYQLDNEPGIFVYNENDQAMDLPTFNTIAHWCFEASEFCIPTSTEEVVDRAVFQFEVNPNPATDQVRIDYDLPETGTTTIRISNMVGQTMQNHELGQQSAGPQQLLLSVDQLAGGMYWLSLYHSGRVSTQKLIIQ